MDTNAVDFFTESPNVQVDAEGLKVRPNHTRCTVILREIPDDTKAEEIEVNIVDIFVLSVLPHLTLNRRRQGLFKSPKCPQIVSTEFASRDTWYVTFASEDDAIKAYHYLRQDVGTFKVCIV